MAITKIETEDESLFPPVALHIRKHRSDIRINARVTPLYCHHCQAQVDGLFQLDGSRYGQVGDIECSCGAIISCVDADNIVEWLDTSTFFEGKLIGQMRIDYYDLYCLGPSYWEPLHKKIGFGLPEKLNSQKITLADIVNLLEKHYPLQAMTIYNKHPLFPVLPAIVAKWIGIIGSMK